MQIWNTQGFENDVWKQLQGSSSCCCCHDEVMQWWWQWCSGTATTHLTPDVSVSSSLVIWLITSWHSRCVPFAHIGVQVRLCLHLLHFLLLSETTPPLSLCAGNEDLDSELWHACAGPLISLPPVNSLVVYWPQGHLEQVESALATMTLYMSVLEHHHWFFCWNVERNTFCWHLLFMLCRLPIVRRRQQYNLLSHNIISHHTFCVDSQILPSWCVNSQFAFMSSTIAVCESWMHF
jgi:hypothetical protein